MNKSRISGWAGAVLCCATLGAIADETAELDKRSETIWLVDGRRCAMYFAQVEGRVVCNTRLDRRFKSWRVVGNARLRPDRSAKLLLGKASRGTASSNVYHAVTFTMSDEERAARTELIGEPKLQAYGYIGDAVVDEIVNPHEFVLREVNLIDEKRVEEAILTDKRNVSTWANGEYDRLMNIARGKRVRQPFMVTHQQLRDLRGEAIEWLYEGQQAMAEQEAAWSGRRLRIVGLSPGLLKVGDPFDGGKVQLSIVAVGAEEVVAVPTTAFTQRTSLEEFEAMLGKLGVRKMDFVQQSELFRQNPDPNHTLHEQIAWAVMGWRAEDVAIEVEAED